MGPEVFDGWTKLLKNELKDCPTKLSENEMKDCSTKLLKNVMQVCPGGNFSEERAEGFPDD